jgi:hypothetical protein
LNVRRKSIVLNIYAAVTTLVQVPVLVTAEYILVEVLDPSVLKYKDPIGADKVGAPDPAHINGLAASDPAPKYATPPAVTAPAAVIGSSTVSDPLTTVDPLIFTFPDPELIVVVEVEFVEPRLTVLAALPPVPRFIVCAPVPTPKLIVPV